MAGKILVLILEKTGWEGLKNWRACKLVCPTSFSVWPNAFPRLIPLFKKNLFFERIKG